MSGTNKLAAEKNQRTLLELVSQPGNDTCADCKARAPRWASHNLGIFICVNCASIHRKIGTHISKVKSVTLDTWTKEQVEVGINMKQIGNVRSNAKYISDETRYPPPTNLIDSERDSELEKYIRGKYEFKTYMGRAGSTVEPRTESYSRKPKPSALTPSSSLDRSAAVAALLGPSRSLASRSSTLSSSRPSTSSSASAPAVSSKSNTPVFNSQTSASTPSSAASVSAIPQARSTMPPLSLASSSSAPVSQTTFGSNNFTGHQSLQPSNSIDATLPLQVVSTPTSAPLPIPTTSPTSYLSAPNPFNNFSAGNNSATSAPPYMSAFGQPTGASPGSMGNMGGVSASPSMNLGMGANYTGTSVSPFQPTPINPTGAPYTPMGSTPSPNPFSSQSLTGMGAPGGYGAPVASQPQTSYGGPMYTGQQFSQQPMQTQQPFSPQPQMQYAQPQAQFQSPTPGNPFMQQQTTPSPYMGAQMHMGSTPSPFGGMQPMQQMNTMQQQQQQQQQQTGFGAPNPFTSWIQQPPGQQQGGYTQQWGM